MIGKEKFWGSPRWNGVAAIATLVGLIIAAISLWVNVQQTNPQASIGVVRIQRFFATSLLPPENFPGAGSTRIKLSISGLSVSPGHLQLRSYFLENLTGRPISASSFDAPIVVHALGGRKIVRLDVLPPANRPPIAVQISSNTATISPMLLNVGEVATIRVLLQVPDEVPLFADPYTNDDGVLTWTTEIKGAELSIVGLDRPQSSWFKANYPGVLVVHIGNAVIAIVVIAVLLSLIQLSAMAWQRGPLNLNFVRGVEISFRIALAWTASEVLVSFADTLLSTMFWINWACLVVYAILLLPLRSRWLSKVIGRKVTPSPQLDNATNLDERENTQH